MFISQHILNLVFKIVVGFLIYEVENSWEDICLYSLLGRLIEKYLEKNG